MSHLVNTTKPLHSSRKQVKCSKWCGHDNVISTINHIAYLHMKKREVNEAVDWYMKELEQIQMGGLVDKRAPCIYSLLSKAEVKRGDFVAAVAFVRLAHVGISPLLKIVSL